MVMLQTRVPPHKLVCDVYYIDYKSQSKYVNIDTLKAYLVVKQRSKMSKSHTEPTAKR